MTRMPVLAFSGSLRGGSLNSALLILAERAAPQVHFFGAELIADLPLFNPDLDGAPAGVPASVRRFRELARAAQAAGCPLYFTIRHWVEPIQITWSWCCWMG